MAQFTSAQFNLVNSCSVSLHWRHTRFYQSISQGGYCLAGLPLASITKVSQRLQALGCTVHSSGRNNGKGFVHFSGSHHIAAKLALMFAAPQGATALVVTGTASIGKRKGSVSQVQVVL